jgi:hypothetical protein
VGRRPPRGATLEQLRASGERKPFYPDARAAREGYRRATRDAERRLKALVRLGDGPRVATTLESLRELEEWAFSLDARARERMGTVWDEVRMLMDVHAARTARRLAPHARIEVREDMFAPGHWDLYLVQGLSGVTVSTRFDREDDERPRSVFFTATRWSEFVIHAIGRVSSDKTLHPAVICNRRRLSRDFGIRHCQTFTLAAGIDAFDERALRASLSSRTSATERVRCLEAFKRLSAATLDRIERLARGDGEAKPFAIAVVLRHRRPRGLELLGEARLSPGQWGVVIRELVRSGVRATVAPLARAVNELSKTEGLLFHHGSEFVDAVAVLWRHAEKGDLVAQAALERVRRRRARIPPETIEILSREVPWLAGPGQQGP